MALCRALTIQSGITTQIGTLDTLAVGSGIDVDIAGSLAIGPSLANAVNIAAAGVTTTVDGYLTVVQAATLSSTLAVTGTSTFGAKLTVTAGGAAVTGGTTTDTLTVTSTSTLDGYVTATGGVGISGGLTSSGATTLTALGTGVVHSSSAGLLSSSLVVVGTDVAGGTNNQILQSVGTTPTWVNVYGDGYIANGVLTVQSAAGNFLVNGNLTVDGYSALVGATTVTGLLTANGGVGTTTLSTSGLATLNSASVTGNATVGGTLVVTGEATLDLTLAVTGLSTLTGSVVTPSVDSISGALSLGTANASAITIGKTGITTTVDGYLSISTLTSGLVYATSGVLSTGGAASLPVADLDPGTSGQVLMTNGSTVTAWETFSQDATVDGSGVVTVLSSHGNFTVGGSGTGNLTVNGTSTLNGNTSVTGAYTFSVGTGATTLGGTLAVTGTSTFTGEAIFNATTGVAVTNAATVGGTLTVGTGLTVTSGGATITGSLTQSGGAFSLDGNAASTITTSSGNTTVDSAAVLDLGTSTATSVSISKTNVPTTVNGALTSTQLLTASAGLTVTSGTITFSPFTSNGVLTVSSSGVVSDTHGTDKQILLTNSSVPVWVTLSGDGYINDDTGVLIVTQAAGNFTVDGSLTVDGTSTLTDTVTTTAGVVVGTTLSVGSTSTFGGLLAANGGVATTTLSTSGLATLNSASVTNDLLVSGGFTVTGTETIVGMSTFMNPATFDNTVTIADAYSLITDSIKSVGSDVLNINGAGGFTLQVNGSTVVDGYSTSVVYIPAGVTLEAQAGGQIIATSSSGTTALTVPFTMGDVSTGAAVYVSSADTVTATNANAIGTSYCVGFVSSAGFVSTDGLVTPIITGGSALAGQVMYLDPTNAGHVTNVAPTAPMQVVAPVGYMKNTLQMIVRVLTPVVL